MSLLSVLRTGAEKFSYAVTKLEANAKAIYAALPAAFHPAVDAAVSLIKQGASDAITAADKAEGPIITDAAELLKGAMRAALTRYVGDPVAGALTAPVSDGVDRIRDALIAEIHSEALYFKAKLATAAPVATAQPAQAAA